MGLRRVFFICGVGKAGQRNVRLFKLDYTSLYALSDLTVGEDAAFNKDYLQGKYGAIPIFNYDELWAVD